MKKALFYIVIVVLCSCKDIILEENTTENYFFLTSQPINEAELKQIPFRYLGRYVNNLGDTLHIDRKIIFTVDKYQLKVKNDKNDSIYKKFSVNKKEYIFKETQEKFTIKQIKNDSIVLETKFIDTLFAISTQEKIKKVKNTLVISKPDDSKKYWKVKWLYFTKEGFYSYQIKNLDLLEEIKTTTKTKINKIDSITFVLQPTRKEFIKIQELLKKDTLNFFKKV